jgi:hypothetical protein
MKNEYNVEVSIILEKEVSIAAKNKEEAERYVRDMYSNAEDEAILCIESDHLYTNITIGEEENIDLDIPKFREETQENRYSVAIRETLQKREHVFADNRKEAISIVQERMDNDIEPYISADNLVATDFKVTAVPRMMEYALNENGERVQVKNIDDFKKAILDSFPSGKINIFAMGQSVENLCVLEEKFKAEGELHNAFEGYLGEKKNMLKEYGLIDTEVVISRNEVDRIYPSSSTYHDDRLAEDGVEEDNNLATSFLTGGDDVTGGRVEIDIRNKKDFENVLLCGIKFPEAMKLIHDLSIKDDGAFLIMADTYKRINGEEKTSEAIRKQISDDNSKVLQLEDGRLVDAHYRPRIDNCIPEGFNQRYYINFDFFDGGEYLFLSKKPKDEMGKNHFLLTKEVLDFKNKRGDMEVINVADVFNKENGELRKRISDITTYRNSLGETMIRCKIDGEQQTGRKMSEKDFKDLSIKYDFLVAAKIFSKELERGSYENQKSIRL